MSSAIRMLNKGPGPSALSKLKTKYGYQGNIHLPTLRTETPVQNHYESQKRFRVRMPLLRVVHGPQKDQILYRGVYHRFPVVCRATANRALSSPGYPAGFPDRVSAFTYRLRVGLRLHLLQHDIY